MIQLGANVLDHKLDSMSNYELVDAILSIFEKNGMTPPNRLIKKVRYLDGHTTKYERIYRAEWGLESD